MVKLAWRNLWRNPRRTGLTLFLVSFSVVLLGSFQVLLDGKMRLLGEGLRLKGVGHLRVEAEVLDTLALKEALTGLAWAPRREERALVSSARGSRPAELWAIDPGREGKVTPFLEGINLEPEDPRGVVLTTGLAKALGVEAGEGVVVSLSGPRGELLMARFVVRQVIQDPPGAAPYSAYITLRGAEEIGLGGPTVAAVVLGNFWNYPKVAREISPRLPEGHLLKTIREFDPAMWAMVKLQDYLSALVVILVYSLAAVGILNTLVVSVVERTREFGLLKALGMSQGRLVATYYWEVGFILLLGMALGLTFAAPTLWFLCAKGIPLQGMEEMARTFNFPVMGTSYTGYFLPLKFLRILLLITVITLLAGLPPLERLRKVQPVQAMRN